MRDCEIVGFIPPEDQWIKMATVFRDCNAQGLPLPAEVEEYFKDGGYREPRFTEGEEIELDDMEAVTNFNDEDGLVIQIELSKLPKNIQYLRIRP